MRSLTRLLPLALALALLASAAPIAPATPASGDGVPYIVGFRALPDEASRGTFQGEAVADVDKALRFVVVNVKGDAATFEARAKHDPNVRYARYDDPAAYHATAMPNDPLATTQWAWTRANATGAWDKTTGSAGVIVAVLDSGVERGHPDLASGRLLQGYDYTNRDNDPADDCGHGTHVIGTLAATSGNGVGVAGTAQVSVLPVKVLNSYCAGSWSSVASGIRYAADKGARVISMSLGCGVSCYDQSAADAIEYAWGKGALVVVAAGNEGPCENCIQFPANQPHALPVGCTDENDVVCSFSSRGAGALMAPGRNILSTVRGGGYGWNNGTSMSTPHVSGAAALALSANGALTNAQLRALLEGTARDLGLAGKDTTYGVGRLDMGALVKAAQGPAPAPSPTPDAARGVTLTPTESRASVSRGGSATYMLTLTNTGAASDTFALTTTGTASGWKVTLGMTSVTLAPGASTMVKLTVKAARHASSGANLGVTVTVLSKLDAATSARATAITTVA